MSKLIFLSFAIILLSVQEAGAQQKRAAYGPVVKAFLTGLTEELTELEYQFSHREISKADYDRSKTRLSIQRRLVERHATRNREDIVPEFQILTEEEFGALGLSLKPDPSSLKVGATLEDVWRLVSIERGRIRFFVFERFRRQPETQSEELIASRSAENYSVRKVDPQEAIETIVIRETPRTRPAPARSPGAITPQAPAGNAVPVAGAEQPPDSHLPRILHIYLPRYTDKAREKRVEGELIVRALLQRDGSIKEPKIEKGLGHGLDQLALESAKRLGFLPARVDGKDVDASAQIIFSFKMDKVTVQLGAIEAGASAIGGKP